MRARITFGAAEVMPLHEAVWARMGIPMSTDTSRTFRAIVDGAYKEFETLVTAAAVVEDVSAGEFGTIFDGDGQNEADAPLGGVYSRAEQLVLFAATVGEAVSARITALFASNDPPRGYALDAVASVAADGLSQMLASRLSSAVEGGELRAVLPYSPGYCGWHITGQRALFDRLRPDEIGITLNDSCLMQPLKSVSGVLVSGPARIHRFRPEFEFCSACTTRECVRRMASVRGLS